MMTVMLHYCIDRLKTIIVKLPDLSLHTAIVKIAYNPTTLLTLPTLPTLLTLPTTTPKLCCHAQLDSSYQGLQTWIAAVRQSRNIISV